MRRVFDVVVVGGANTDYLVRGSALPRPGATAEGEEFCEGPGGKGANQAVAVARLGASVAWVGRLGSDERGRALLGGLRKEGVDVGAVSFDPVAPTGVALVMVDGTGQKQIMTAPGANSKLDAAAVEKAREWIAGARVLLLPLEAPRCAVERTVELARSSGAAVVLDAAPPRPLPDHLLTRLDIVRANADEAEALTQIPITNPEAAKRAGAQLLDRGARAALVGAPTGNWLASAEGGHWFEHLPLEAVDATGAGDSLAAALAAQLARGQSLVAATRFACTVAALKTTKLGVRAGLPRLDEVERLLAGEVRFSEGSAEEGEVALEGADPVAAEEGERR